MVEDYEHENDAYKKSDELLDDDELDPQEAAFMQGYEEAGETKPKVEEEPDKDDRFDDEDGEPDKKSEEE